MSDLVIFVAIVGLVAAAGIALGMIVARRIDRIIAPDPDATMDAETEVPPAAEPEDHEEEQLS